MSEEEFNEIKELVIRMRKYMIGHDVLMGECVSWNDLKSKFGAGKSDEEDWAWLRQRDRERESERAQL